MNFASSQSQQAQLLPDILLKLDIAAFAKNGDGFSPLYTPPQWFEDLYSIKQEEEHIGYSEQYQLAETFPFIENFLFDADKLWENHETVPLQSGLWSENLDDLYELNLEATAISSHDMKLLLISNETKRFEIRKKVFQNARDIALKNERLESSIYKHQRELQQKLESIYKYHHSFDEINNSIKEESTAVLICRQDGSVEVFNKALIDIYTLPKKSSSQEKSMLKKWSEEAERQYPEIYRVLETGQHWEGEFETTDSNNTKKWVRLMIAPIFNDDNSIEHYICVANDISNIKLSAREIELLTQVDPNTHLPNRRNFWNQIGELIEACQSSGEKFALFYLDLDHFKQVNDDLGPEQADFLLNAVANRLKQCLKKNDFIAHLGGDEFAVIIKNNVDQNSLFDIAMRIKDNIYRDISFGDFTLNVSVSIGIALYPEHGIKSHLLVKNADYAMYHAKEMGRNQVQFASPSSNQKIKRKLHIEQGLKNALLNQEFSLLFQPQICLYSSDKYRSEALIRWHHPQHGLISPNDFIGIAEESGIILDIGRWVIDTACRELQKLNRNGYRTLISVNVSPKQFRFFSLADDVRAALKKYAIPASQLELEVTESVFLDNMDMVVKQLNILKSLGITVALDDFGTGFSSLNYLKKLPIDILKIDRSFIQELPDNQHSRTIVDSVIRMSHQLGIKVVAEGIETDSQLQYLKNVDCDYVQGFLLHTPLSSGQLVALYQSMAPSSGPH